MPEERGLPALDYRADFLPQPEADRYLQALSSTDVIAWRQDRIRIAGRYRLIPRLSAWYGDADVDYGYSGIRLEPLPWNVPLTELKSRVETAAGARFNSVLLNLYRSEADSMGWHADDEPELGPDPIIASVSLGMARRFDLRPKAARGRGHLHSRVLEHGSLLIMRAGVQRDWLHRLPRQRLPCGPRVNLTFRWVERRRR